MILIISTCMDNLSEEEFVRPIVNILEKSNKMIEYKVIHYSKLTTPDIKKCEKVIICGTALKDNRYIDELKNFEFLKETTVPVLGICSGMQIIALMHGGMLKKNTEIGMITIKVLKKNIFFDYDFEGYSLHGNGLTNLTSFDILAESARSPQIIKHKKKEQYGMMFHPEVRHKQVILKFLDKK